MFTGQVLNSEAEVNYYIKLAAINFIPGSTVKFVFQIVDDQTGLRYVPPSTAIVTVHLNNVDGTRHDFITETFADDRSMRFVELEEEDTQELNGGNAAFTIDKLGDGTIMFKGLIANGLAKNVDGVY